jgi:hypothetical protein
MNANAYNQKKVISVTYTCEDYFRIPCNLDLNNKEQVEEHWIKWNVLCIKLKGVEEVVKIESENGDCPANIDWKNPHSEEIVDAHEYWMIGDPDLPFPKVDMKTGEVCDDEDEEEAKDEDEGKTFCTKCDTDMTGHDFECYGCGWFDEDRVWVCEHCGDTINKEIEKCGCSGSM